LKHNIAKGVMTLIDDFRAQTLQEAMIGAREIGGGSAANTMAGLASLGARGAFEGKVKDDRLGHAFNKSMTDLGLHYTTSMAASGPSTAFCLIAVTPDGQRSMNTYLGAAREFSIADVDIDQIAQSQVLYIEGYLWDAPLAKEASLKAMEAAKKAGTKVAFTLSDPFLVGRYRGEFLKLLDDGMVDIVFANQDEAKSLYEVEEFDSVLQRMRAWHGIAAITRSAEGCVIAQKNEVHVIDAHPVERVVDTTGAGDQFAAGFLYNLTHGRSLADCGRLGALAAAEVISHYGARPEVSLKTLATSAGLL
jgi:sugar/nucleoside kinase (ribokinase family)